MGNEWTVVIGLLITSTIAPVVALIAQAVLQARKERREYDRQDAVAARLLEQQALAATRAEEAATHAAAALDVAKQTAAKIDGMLVDRDKAHEAKGAASEAERGRQTAETLREGQLQGRADEKASRDLAGAGDAPVKVADKPTQDATERSAEALERTADATVAAGKAAAEAAGKPKK